MSDSLRASSYPVVWDKPPFIKRAWLRWSIIIGGGLYIIAALASMDINIQRVIEGIPRGQDLLNLFFHQTLQIIGALFGKAFLKVFGWPLFRLSLELRYLYLLV